MNAPDAPVGAPASEWLLGSWQLLRSDAPVEIQPGTTMHFAGGSALEYRIPTPSGELRATLRWEVLEGILRTQLEDGSNPTEVAITQGEGDVLVFDFGGPRAWFVRVR